MRASPLPSPSRTLAALGSFVAVLARIGASPDDREDVRVRKAFLVATAILIMPAGVVWGVIYVAFGEPIAASIPLGYVVVSSASIAVFARTRSLPFLRTVELGLILATPFLLMVALGGYVPSSAVILWSLLAPLGAIVFDEWRRLPGWIAAYLVLVAVGGPLGTTVRSGNALPDWLIGTFFALNVGTVSFIAFVLLATFARQRQDAIGLARHEQQRADRLLLDILPHPIAEILKAGSRTIADRLDGATILFADVVDFTPLAARLPPEEVVGLLDRLFSHFDALAEANGLEKIKTIGDAYMVAGGVPEPDPDHARSVARMALAMRDSSEAGDLVGAPVRLRIGINSGPVVAGVIGRKRPIYDLWGDAVNLASRMESQGEPGRIQVTRSTYELLCDEFILEPRGTVSVKGRGDMETWYLVGERTDGHAPEA